MISDLIQSRIDVITNSLSERNAIDFIRKVAKIISQTSAENKRIFICGNGGSASQASHFVAELTVRYKTTRNSYNVIALATDYSFLSAACNDFCFEEALSMQIDCLGQKDDLLVVLSTSGNSPNIVNALKSANQKQMETIGLLGKSGGLASKYISENNKYIVNNNDTAIIQELHLMLIHLICEQLEKEGKMQ